jgi:hypothetical protein
MTTFDPTQHPRESAGQSTGGQFAQQRRAEPEVSLPSWQDLEQVAADPNVSDEDYYAAQTAKIAADEARWAGRPSMDDLTAEQRTNVDFVHRSFYEYALPLVGCSGLDTRDDAEEFASFAARYAMRMDGALEDVPGAPQMLRLFEADRGARLAVSLCRGVRQEGWVASMARHPGLSVSQFGSGVAGARARADARGFVRRLQEEGVLICQEPNGSRGGMFWRIVGTRDPFRI